MQEQGANEITPVCPEGFDYRQLRSYVRSSEEDGIPPDVVVHVGQCDACRPKWEFLERTDPIVRKQFESRVLGLAEQVVIQEIIFKPLVLAASSSSVGIKGASQIAELLRIPDPWWQEPAIDRIRDTTTRLGPEFVVHILDRVRGIPDEKERQQQGQTVRALFGERLERKVSRQTLFEAYSRLWFGDGEEVLDDDIAVEAAAALPENVFATEMPLLTLVGDHARFNVPEFQRLRSLTAAR
jgi:hypothetical protein